VALAAAVALAASRPPAPSEGVGADPATLLEAPLAFEPAAGRTPDRVEFIAHSVAGGSLYLTRRAAVLALPRAGGDSRALRLDLGAMGTADELRPLEALPGKANSFIGDDRSRWRSGIPTYSRVRYSGVHPGIDLDFYGNQGRLEYDFRLAAGADPARIAVGLRGADSVRVAGTGALVIRVGSTTIRQPVPVAYQRVGGERSRVRAAYELDGSTVGFDLGAYDRSRPLVIDPLVLAYSTYLGGGQGDFANGIAVDSAGAAYIVGETNSTDFPTQDPRDADLPDTDAFVTKLAPDSGGAVSLAYSTYLGGGALDVGNGVDVDSSGAAYVTGSTGSTDFPTVLQYQSDQGGFDAWVARVSPDTGGAVTLSWSTYLGGGSSDANNGNAIAVDPTGAVYVAGQTDSNDFPTVQQYQADQGDTDAFVTKLRLPAFAGNLFPVYSTYLGGSGGDLARWDSIAVDAAGAAYITGQTDSADFPTVDQYQGDQPSLDAFATRLPPNDGTTPLTPSYSTYLGGDAGDIAGGIAVDAAGAAHVVGSTESADFPTADAVQGEQPSGSPGSIPTQAGR
jgi:hypothetical protein